MKKLNHFLAAAAVLPCIFGCEPVDHFSGGEGVPSDIRISMPEVARLLSEIPIGTGQVEEVHDAVISSSANGYDEEYTMADLFSTPGSGVGDKETKAGPSRTYDRPMKDLISDYLHSSSTGPLLTRAGTGSGVTPEEYLAALKSSGFQIYWPYCEEWDGKTYPVITFDPDDGSEVNEGYRLVEGPDGSRSVETVIVSEEMAAETPVWVINRNDDSGYTSLEMLRRQDPDWGKGGDVIIGVNSGPSTKGLDGDADFKTLILKDFRANRNYDSWFAGASEFFVKCGCVEDFKATTEEEMKLYKPSITDFMIVVKRRQVGQRIPFNAVLVSQWTDQLENCAFLITEDDGGTHTSWKCGADVKVKSKTYGVEMEIPLNTRDDIVWRGKLSSGYLEKYSNLTGHFGDVEITFRIVGI